MNGLPTESAAIVAHRWWKGSILMDIEVLGIDLGKSVCSLAELNTTAVVVFRKRLQRHCLLNFLENLRPCVVAMEACGGAHHIGRFAFSTSMNPA